MTISVKFCGGCNPTIDRGGLFRSLQKKGKELELKFKAVIDFEEVDPDSYLLIINGCQSHCVFPPEESKNEYRVIIVAGETLDEKKCPESELADRIIARVTADEQS